MFYRYNGQGIRMVFLDVPLRDPKARWKAIVFASLAFVGAAMPSLGLVLLLYPQARFEHISLYLVIIIGQFYIWVLLFYPFMRGRAHLIRGFALIAAYGFVSIAYWLAFFQGKEALDVILAPLVLIPGLGILPFVIRGEK